MDRRDFLKITGTLTGGMLVLPEFLYSFATQQNSFKDNQCLVFIQLNGGNDGLNTFVPYKNELYYKYRRSIFIDKKDVISSTGDMAFHPSLSGLAEIQQKGSLTVLQNVGYPEPDRSHFRSQEIWQTGSSSKDYLSNGWLGRFLDIQCKEHQPTAGINFDAIDNLALKGVQPNAITLQNPQSFSGGGYSGSLMPSGNPQLDFVRRVASSIPKGSGLINKAIEKAPETSKYPQTGLGKNLSWIARLIKGGLNSNVYYTSLSGFDTHDRQLGMHEKKLKELGDATLAIYEDLKASGKLDEVTIVIFSEFGRRVQDNGSGTDHGTAAPMFIIGGGNKGKVIGKNPNLANLDNGDLIHETDFRSVYAALLKDKFSFDPKQIGISNAALRGIF